VSPRPYGPQAAGYRYRRGCFQINLALSARPHFRDGRLDAGGALNLGRGVDALVTSVRQAGDGLLPKHPSISWHEPTAVDPTRAPAGRAVVRLQVLDVPHTPAGTRPGHATAPTGGIPPPPRPSPTASWPRRSCTPPAWPGWCWSAT